MPAVATGKQVSTHRQRAQVEEVIRQRYYLARSAAELQRLKDAIRSAEGLEEA